VNLFHNFKYHPPKSSLKGGFFSSPLEGRLRGVIPLIFVFIFAFPFSITAQSPIKTKSGAKIEILNANTLEYEEIKGVKVKRLIGDVQLKHDDALMFCDSAFIYSNTNTMDAYSNVRINQGDSLRMYGDSLKYNGNTRIAILRGDIRLVNNDVTLTTNYLDYNRNDNVAYYYGGGTMINQKENNTLTSDEGYYYSNGEAFYFKKDVVLINPEYEIKADTLNYNSTSEIVNFLGPTTITSDANFIYTEDGWYNTVNDKSKFYKNAYLFSEGKIIEGDTLYYDRNSGYGEIICNGTITDTVENIITQGDVVHFFEKQDSAMITQEAMMKQLMDDDTLYMHADTFIVSTQYIIPDSLKNETDTAKIIGDTVRTLFAYRHTKFYMKEMQGKADSVVYDFSDSTINFYHDPIIWSKENQITADFIYMVMKEGEIDRMFMNENAFIISKVDSITENFNQIKGKNMIGYFVNKELNKIDVKQNSETIYYAIDEDGKYIGVNNMSGEDMLIYLKDNELQTITFIKEPRGELTPLKDVSPKDVILKGFNWRIYERPNDMFEIFISESIN
jgi:lipopolysaccharide export system protein LptA